MQTPTPVRIDSIETRQAAGRLARTLESQSGPDDGRIRLAALKLLQSGTSAVFQPPSPYQLTPDPAYSTVSPVTCSGKRYPSSRPFLIPPYLNYARLYSYFDHDFPDYEIDGRITVANGMSLSHSSIESSRFGVAEDFPAYWSPRLRQFIYYDGHNGYDYDVYYQPIDASAAGRVIFAGWNYEGYPRDGYGKMVMIDHENGYVTLYGHLSRIAVREGQFVHSGEVIGVSGNTGHSTGPHLHFTVFHNCKPTDPYGWTGQKPDPLVQYQGEQSSYLWIRPPGVYNPLPGWPGMSQIGPPPISLTADLTLPHADTFAGFLRKLDAERTAVQAALRQRNLTGSYDWAAAAFTFNYPATARALYALPYTSAVTPNSIDDMYYAKASLSDKLADLSGSVSPRDQLNGGPWTAFIFHFKGRELLLGRGPANRTVQFRLPASKQPAISTVSDAGGAFAIPMEANIPAGARIVIISTDGRQVLSKPKPPAPADGPSGKPVKFVSRDGGSTQSDASPPKPVVARHEATKRQQAPDRGSSTILILVPIFLMGAVAGGVVVIGNRRKRRPTNDDASGG